MDFARHVGAGYGSRWRGVLFRRRAKDLELDLIPRSCQWFRQIFPSAEFVAGAKSMWRWPTGEMLLLRHARSAADYWDYHGSEFPWIGWEELTNWPDGELYELMMTLCRSTHPGMPRKVRSTTNPFGVGHHWVKQRFKPNGGVSIVDDSRAAIFSHIDENVALDRADPEYRQNLEAITDPNKRAAWLHGDWDIVAGGMVDDVWDRSVHVVEPFTVPESWKIFRAFDWGSSKPFSVGWWAESDGTAGKGAPTVPRRTLFRIGEWYGWNGRPNEGIRLVDTEIARGILERERDMGIADRVKPGPADPAIFTKQSGDSPSLRMARLGVRWLPADNKPGSRVSGAETVRSRLEAAREAPMESPGLFVFSTCYDGFIRTVPVIPRDERKPEDVDTDAEDHVWDETRYALCAPRIDLPTRGRIGFGAPA